MNNINLFNNESNSIPIETQETEKSSSDEKITTISIQTIENSNQLSSLSDREFLGSIEQFSSRWEDSSINSTTLEEAIDAFFENAPQFPADDLEPSFSLSTDTIATEDSFPVRDQNRDSQIKEIALQTSAVSIPTLLPKLSVEPPTRKRKWSEKETAYLTQMYYEKLSYDQIANNLNRTKFSCSDKISKLLSNG